MSDDIDQASASEEQYRQAALSDFRHRTRVQGPALRYCVVCGETIEAERRRILPGCRLCVACKTREEAMSRHRVVAWRREDE
jgi:phage/conjugal plasmid C-4 type zinc finger TraR family protein